MLPLAARLLRRAREQRSLAHLPRAGDRECDALALDGLQRRRVGRALDVEQLLGGREGGGLTVGPGQRLRQLLLRWGRGPWLRGRIILREPRSIASQRLAQIGGEL